MNERQPLPMTNEKLWKMAKMIVEKLKCAKSEELDKDVYWQVLEEEWFDWLENYLFEEDDVFED